jgi:hypothetical protein
MRVGITASAGNICTVRCRNNAQAGPFGGCFPVQQVDTTASVNTPSNIQTSATLDAINKQVEVNKQDLSDANAALAAAGAADAVKNNAAAASIGGISTATGSFPTLTVSRFLPLYVSTDHDGFDSKKFTSR